MNRKLRGLMFTIPGLVLGAVGAWSCSNAGALPGLGDIAKQCGLECDAGGVAAGNGSISGTASVDAFFTSVVHFDAAATAISDGIQAELDAIGASVGATAGDNADLKTKLAAKLTANVSGGLKVTYQPPECSVSAHATLQAQAKCDVSVDPGTASVKCEGSCTAEASATVACDASATVSCTGTAPALTCSGTCKGDCELKATAKCDGTCNGTCTGTCSVKDAAGNCAGSCSGTCQGNCKLDAAGTCGGSCKGECTYTPPSGKCDATAEAHCEAKAGASVDCKGSCSGNVTPPKAKAECEASAKADASVSAECKPPALNVSFQLTAAIAADATASANFQAWLEGFKGHVSAILAFKAKLNGVATAGAGIASTAEGAIKGSVSGLVASPNIRVAFGINCALAELPKAVALVTAAGTKLKASGTAAVDVLGSVGVT
jgi:hypothetical protein